MKLRLMDRACALAVFAAGVLAAPMAPGQTFNDGYFPEVNNSILAMALQPDGKVIIGGAFTNVGGAMRRYIARLNADGTLDAGFNPGADAYVYALAVQADGRIVAGGIFYDLGGPSQHGLSRLNPDGSLDTSFRAGVDGIGVFSLLVQPDGKLVVGGLFRTLYAHLTADLRTNLARLNVDGTMDSLNSGAGYYINVETQFGVNCLAQQTDGRLLVGGNFPSLAGQPCSRLGRLNLDGTLDKTFATNADGVVGSLVLQPDGKVLLGGRFSSIGGISQKHLARLNEDGTLDTSFAPIVNSNVATIVLQPDGRILVGGSFTNINGQTRNRIARLQPDGSLDSGFNPGADGSVNCMALQTDGKILVAGNFLMLDGRYRSRLGRLHADGSVELWRPLLSKPLVLSNGAFEFTYFLPGNRSVVMQTSTNLTQWQAIGSRCCSPHGLFPFTDSLATNYSRRFYRLWVP